MFLDQLFILRHSRGTTITRPIRVRVIAEADVDVLVICKFLEFLGNIIGDEDEIKLGVFKGCRRNEICELQYKLLIQDGRTATGVHCARVHMTISGACCEHGGLCSFHDLMQAYRIQ